MTIFCTENSGRVVPIMKKFNSVLGKILLAIILLQVIPVTIPQLLVAVAAAPSGIVIVVNQSTSTLTADHYFDNLTIVFNLLNGSSFNSVLIIVDTGSYNETFPGAYVLNNVTVTGRNATIKGNTTLVLRLVNSRNVTFANLTFYNFTFGIQLENSSMIRFADSNLVKMSLPAIGPLSLPTDISRSTRTLRTPTLPRLKRRSEPTPASYKLPGSRILADLTLGGAPAILLNNTSDVLLENLVLSDSYGGIFMLNSTNITIRNTVIYNMTGGAVGGGGIGGYNSNTVLIDNVTVYNCNYTGVYLYSTLPSLLTGIIVRNVTLTNLPHGIEVDSQNGLVTNINGSNIDDYFIIVYGVNNRLENILGSNSREGVYVAANYSSINNVVLSNVGIGVDLDFAVGNNVSDIFVNSSDIAVYVSFSNNTRISNVTIENAVNGVYLEFTEDNLLEDVVLRNIGDGGAIVLDTCFNTTISNTTINASNYDGLGLYYTNNTSVDGVTIIDALWPIYLWSSHNNSFSNVNVTTLIGAYTSYGIEIEESRDNNFSHLRIHNITDADTGYLGVDYPVGIALFGNSSASIAMSTIEDIRDPATGRGVGILLNNSSVSLGFTTVDNTSTGILSVNNTSGIFAFFTAFSNHDIGISLNESTGHVILAIVVVENTTTGLYSDNSNITAIHFVVANSYLGMYLYNATNATLNNIAVNASSTGIKVVNTNELNGMNLTINNATIISGDYAIYVEDKSYASNITLNNITANSRRGIRISTDESHWGSTSPTNITITSLVSENATDARGAGLLLWLNETPVNLYLENITVGNSNAGLILVGVGARGGNTSIVDGVEIYNTTSYEAIIVENTANTTLRNLHITQASSGGIAIGAYLGAVSNITLENVSLENIDGAPIRIGNATNVTITHVYIENPAITLDYRVKGNATIHAVNTTLAPPPTGNNTPLGVYANVTLHDTQSWIQLTYTYPTSLGYPIVKWMYYNTTLDQWVDMPTTIVTLNATHKLVTTNHTGATLLGVFGTSPPVGGKLQLYTANTNPPTITLATIILAALAATITIYKKKKH